MRAGPDVASVGGMWRLAIAVVCVLAGCGTDGPAEPMPDAAVAADAQVDAPVPLGGHPGNGSLDVGVGGACRRDDDYACNEYGGACVEHTCRLFCLREHCPDGASPKTEPIGAQCVCVPD